MQVRTRIAPALATPTDLAPEAIDAIADAIDAMTNLRARVRRTWFLYETLQAGEHAR